MIFVSLTSEEIAEAEAVARARQDYNVARGIKDKHGAKGGYEYHRVGAMGERAVAKWLDISWDGKLGDFKAKDVGGYQVRTRAELRYDTLIYRTDKDDNVFISAVLGKDGCYLRGWIYAWEAKKEEYWKDPAGGRPNYFVPTERLNKLTCLPPESLLQQ